MSFILLGQHRSGTSYLLDLIRHHPDVDTINEPFSMHLDFFRNNEEKWEAEDYKEDILHDTLYNYTETIKYIKELNKWMNIDFPNLRGFKETALFEKYAWLKQVINFDKKIILVRDPRAVVVSILKRNMQNTWWDYKGKLTTYYMDKIKDISIIEIPIMTCATLWKARARHLMNIIEKESCLLVRLEDVLFNPNQELSKIMRYLDLDVNDDQIEFFDATSKESRDFTYSNFRKKEEVLYAWESKINKKDRENIERLLHEELMFFEYI